MVRLTSPIKTCVGAGGTDMIRTITIVVSVILIIRIVYYLISKFHRKNRGYSRDERGTGLKKQSAVPEGATHEAGTAEEAKLKRVQQPGRDESLSPRWNLRKPIQCVFWEKPELICVGRPFEAVEDLIDESHLTRSILKCRECGQLYFYEFYEIVDWEDGDDKQYSTYFPVDTREQIEALNASSVFEIHQFSPRLNGTHWIGK